MQAAILGNQEALQLLIANRANVNNQDQDGATALIWAAEAGKEKVVELLLQAGASTQLKTRKNIHALYIAAQNGHQSVARNLLDKGAEVDERGHSGFTALWPAVSNGHTEVARLLLDRGANPNIADEKKVTPLEIAAVKGHVEIVRMLLEKGAAPNPQDELGMTPLFRASLLGHEAIVRLLLAHGADPNISSESMGGTPLLVAAQKGHAGIVKALIDKEAKVEKKGARSTPVIEATAYGNTATLKLLLDQGASVNETSDLYNYSALRVAADVGNEEKVTLLLERGADPNQRDVWLMTPLMVAAEKGHVAAVDLLLAHGADIKAKDRDELSATEYALLGKDQIEEELAKHEEEDKKDTLDKYDQVVLRLVEAEKARRTRRSITPRLVFVTKTGGCSLSTLDPMTGVTTPWRTLKTCPEDMFVSDQPEAVILRTKNKLEVFPSGATTTEAVKAISLPAPDKKGWKTLFQIAGQLTDGRLAIGYREQYGKEKADAKWRWTLYAYTQGKWVSVEQKDCLRPSWCLLTPFSGRSVKKNLGDEDWLWHPYVRHNPFFTEAGYAEMDSAEKFTKTQSNVHQAYGYRYKKFTVEGKEHLLYYDQSPGRIYQTGERRYEVERVYLERSGTVPSRLSGDFNMGALEGKFLLWTDGLRNEYPQLRLLDIDTGSEPIQELHMAAWVYWAMAEGNGSQVVTPSTSSPQARP
jgi:ankyrin repeat protein